MKLYNQRLWLERLHNFKYYKSLKFACMDLSFGLVALFINPYRTCRKFLQKKGAENIYAYGETPYATYERIAQICELKPGDTWVELGAGRGKGCFWLAHFTGCKVIGVEWIELFVGVAKAISALFRMQNLSFERGDIEKVDLKGATVIYLYGIWPEMEFPAGARVISVSEPLEGLEVIKKFWVRYPWGRTTAFLQIKKDSPQRRQGHRGPQRE